MRRHATGAALLALTLAACPAAAETTARDLHLLARALGFLEPPPTGWLDLGILYPARSAAGRAEAERIAAAMAGGLRAGRLQLRPRLVTLEDAPTVPTAAFLLTGAALPHAAELAAALAGRGILTVTREPAAVAAGAVVMAVRAEPRVEILVSRDAARAANIGFSGAFRMMIQER